MARILVVDDERSFIADKGATEKLCLPTCLVVRFHIAITGGAANSTSAFFVALLVQGLCNFVYTPVKMREVLTVFGKNQFSD